MTAHLKAGVGCLGLTISLLSGSILAAQQKDAVPAAPIPAQILTAKKVFVANGGGDQSREDYATYTGGPNRAYNEFYAALKSWGRYELVATPADADLIFEVRLTVFQLLRARVLGSDDQEFDSQLRFVIRDVKTQQVLWGLTQHVPEAVLQSNRDKNFEQSLAAIVAEAKRIAGPGSAAVAKN